MTYDGSSGRVVLFQARWQDGAPQAETWTWDGRAWTQQHPAHTPSPRGAPGMAYDSIRQNVVLFGGLTVPATNLLSDTWTWNGKDWSEHHPAASPSPRIAQVVFDVALGEAVLIGGSAGQAGQLSDMWGWNGVTWSRLAATLPDGLGPPLRAAYDNSTASIVALGCDAQSMPTNVYDGMVWHQYSSGELHTCAPAIAFDTARSAVVVFGGNAGSVTNATWTWSGTHWTQQAPRHSPPPRFVAAAAFDPKSSQVIVFGGMEPYGFQNAVDVATTWAWDGTDWSQLAG
jgi:hypothetical protein